jgi:hypothetical protein
MTLMFQDRRKQSGYLMEIPLLMAGVGLLLAVLVPRLPGILGKALVCLGAVVWIGGLFYMLVLPGWLGGATPRLRGPWKLVVFIAVSVTIIAAVISYVLFS